MAKISIIIVSYNRLDLLGSCLEAISTGTSSAHEIIVVNNASTEGSARVVCKKFASVRLIENSCNFGYAVAVNQGARLAGGDCLMLLNPDTVPLPGAIDQLAAFLDAQPKAGICGPKNVDEHGAVVRSVYRFPTFWSLFWRFALTGPLAPLLGRYYSAITVLVNDERFEWVDWLAGCAFLIRADLFRKLGGFDEGYFMYFEEPDFCLRARSAGWACAYVPSAAIIHHRAQSALTTREVMLDGMLAIPSLRSKYRYAHKHLGWLPSQVLRMTDLAVAMVFSICGLVFSYDNGRSARFQALGEAMRRAALMNDRASHLQKQEAPSHAN